MRSESLGNPVSTQRLCKRQLCFYQASGGISRYTLQASLLKHLLSNKHGMDAIWHITCCMQVACSLCGSNLHAYVCIRACMYVVQEQQVALQLVISHTTLTNPCQGVRRTAPAGLQALHELVTADLTSTQPLQPVGQSGLVAVALLASTHGTAKNAQPANLLNTVSLPS